jgi:HD-like signal output (HDOD) protein/ActR/RegA family two-component response regulator
MATKNILLAMADTQALADISQALGAGWMSTSSHSEEEALAQLEKYEFDALLVDFNLGSPDSSELLNLALEERPNTSRFLLAYEADLALVAAKVSGAHQILPKPMEIASVKSRIEEAMAPEATSGKEVGAEAAPRTSAAPIIPAIYAEVLKALESPQVTTQQVGEIIARDEELTAEVLRLTNGAYLGSPRDIGEPTEAVAALGLGTVKAVVMALQFLAENRQLNPGYLSFDEIWQHNTNVALIARDLVMFETNDRALAGEAFVAGLVHDLGKIVLVKNFEDLYGRVHSLARKQPAALWEIEKEMFGANHGEIGGCLVGMWNLPGPVVEAAALHHDPPVGEQQQLTPLAAIHIANVLEHQIRPSDDFQVQPVISAPFLNDLGLLQRLPVWRAAFANGGTAIPELAVEAPETPQSQAATIIVSGRQPARPATRRAASRQYASEDGSLAAILARLWQGRWVYGGSAAALVLLLALWIGTRRDLNDPLPAYARTPTEPPLPVALAPTPEKAPAPASPATPATTVPTTVPEEKPAANVTTTTVPTVPKPAPATPAPVTAPAVAQQPATAANVSPSTTTSSAAVINAAPSITPTASAVPNAALATTPAASAASFTPAPLVSAPLTLAGDRKADFRLNGIIYMVNRPLAILNGITVRVGDHLNGATVISIGPKQVTLQVKGRLKTLELN